VVFIPACIARTLLCAGIAISIPAIQGGGHTSPLVNTVVETRGIVTVVTPSGFYFQDANGDDDDTTSDGLYVYAGAAPTVRVGDDVVVDAAVAEFLPGGAATNLTVTELHDAIVRIVARDRPLPAPVLIGASGRIPPARVIDDDGLTRFDPTSDGIDFWESLESMRVRLGDCTVVGPTNTYGECWVVAAGTARDTSARGGVTATHDDCHPERIQIDDGLLPAPLAKFNTGDRTGDIVGIVSYRFGAYEVLPTVPPSGAPGEAARDVTRLSDDADHLLVATFNVHNLGPDDGARMPRIGGLIAHALGAPDILALEEIEDSSGPIDDGIVDATATLDALIDAIAAAGGPVYDARELPPLDGADGGAPGSNIRVALLFNPARVAVVDREDDSAGFATTPVPTDSGVVLSRSPGRIDPFNEAWHDSRKPLATEFVLDGERVFVVACHFASKYGSSPEFGAVQPPFDAGSAQRRAQAGVVRDFVAAIARDDARARIIVAGDFNDDWFAGALSPLESSVDLFDTAWLLSEPERYTYVFDGMGHAYDRVFVSRPLTREAEVDVVHVAAEFSAGDSDHDPTVVRLRIRSAPTTPRSVVTPLRIYPNPGRGDTTIELSAPDGAIATFEIFDVRGSRVRSLRGKARAGTIATTWDGRDDRGHPLPGGIYVVRSRTGGRTMTRKVLRISGAPR
jgi:predicted extracellular nuclease